MSWWEFSPNITSQDSGSIENTNLGAKKIKSLIRELFDEGIDKLVISGNIGQMKLASCLLVTKKMEINYNVLHTKIKRKIRTQVCDANIVLENSRWTLERIVEFKKERFNLCKLYKCGSKCFILYLCWWSSNQMFLFIALGDQIVAKINNICICWCTIIKITRQINILKRHINEEGSCLWEIDHDKYCV